ncbi:MAG TPA: transposase [Chloroflexota bacterium]|nr:transposase [Chloroflexota bacterium]HUM67222.1 transposase [Chloroflexota bacterium]
MVSAFLETIPARLRRTIHTFCTDMWEGYLTAIAEFISRHEMKGTAIVVDRFHVAQHYRDGFDQLRKQEMRRLKQELATATYTADFTGALWLLRHNHEDLDEGQQAQLRRLLTHSPHLHLAYTLRQELTAIFEMKLSRKQAETRLLKWIAKVERTSLTCFDDFIKSLRHHLAYIANYFIRRASSGFVEGLNNKVKVIKRRCYGIKKVSTLFQRIWLDLEGYKRYV